MTKILVCENIVCFSWGPVLQAFEKTTGNLFGSLNWNERAALEQEFTRLEANMDEKIKEEKQSIDLVDMKIYEKLNFLVAATTDKCIRLIDMKDNSLFTRSQKNFNKQIACCEIANLKDELAVATKFGDVEFFELPSLKSVHSRLGHLSIITDLKYSSNDKYIVTSDKDFRVRISNYPEVYIIQGFCLGHQQAVSCIALEKNERYLVSGSLDGTLCVWRLPLGEHLFRVAFKDIASKNLNTNYENLETDAIINVSIDLINEDNEREPLTVTHLAYCYRSDVFAAVLNHSSDVIIFKFEWEEKMSEREEPKKPITFEKQFVISSKNKSKILDIAFDEQTGNLLLLKDSVDEPCQVILFYPNDANQYYGPPDLTPNFVNNINGVLKQAVRAHPTITPKYKHLTRNWEIRDKRPRSEVKDEDSDNESHPKKKQRK